MDVFKTRYFKYCRLQLLCIGMWPYQNKLAAMSIRVCFAVLTAVLINGEIQRIIKSRDQLQLCIEPIPYLLTACAVSIKFLTIWFRSETMRKTMNRIQYDWHNAALNNEDHLLEANAERGWRFCRLYILIVCVHSAGMLSLQIIPEILNMSISNNITRFMQHVRGELFLDQDKYYALILSYVTLMFICGMLATTAMALQWIMMINHACGMFAIFGYIATVNSSYTIYYAALALMAIIIISTFMIQVYDAINHSHFQNVCILAMFCIICLWYVFIEAFPAQKLIDTSSNVFRQIYNGEWYNASITDQKTLLFIMQNCMKPITITTATIITISMEQFGMVVRVSISCFMVLYSLS